MSSLAGKDNESILGGVDDLSDFSDGYDGTAVNVAYHAPDELKDNLRPSKSSKKKFRYSANSVFLTFPQCNMSRQECLSYLQGKTGCIKEAAICQELHGDGNPHLHCYLGFTKRVNYRSCTCFDVNNFHPHISAIRSLPGVLRYISKEDKNVLCFNMDLKKIVGGADKKASTSSLVGQMILEGATALEIVQRYPSWATRLPQLVSAINTYNSLKSAANYGLRENFVAYWIYGDAGIGKSFAIRKLVGEENVYFKSFNSKYWDGYNGDKHRVVVLDDYHGDNQIPFADLKRIADHYPYYLDMKGITQVPARYQCLIVTSNYSIEECCKNSKKCSKQIIEPMKRRFVEIDANKYICGDFFNFEYFLDKNCLTLFMEDWCKRFEDWVDEGIGYLKCVQLYKKSLAENTTVRKLLGKSESDNMKEERDYKLWNMIDYNSKFNQFSEDFNSKLKKVNENKLIEDEYE